MGQGALLPSPHINVECAVAASQLCVLGCGDKGLALTGFLLVPRRPGPAVAAHRGPAWPPRSTSVLNARWRGSDLFLPSVPTHGNGNLLRPRRPSRGRGLPSSPLVCAVFSQDLCARRGVGAPSPARPSRPLLADVRHRAVRAGLVCC